MAYEGTIQPSDPGIPAEAVPPGPIGSRQRHATPVGFARYFPCANAIGDTVGGFTPAGNTHPLARIAGPS